MYTLYYSPGTASMVVHLALLEVPSPAQQLIHVHPGADELGRVYQPAIAIAATPGAFLAAMNGHSPIDAQAWRGTAEFAPAFERAVACAKPALLHLKLDPQALTPNASLDELRAQGLASRRG